jgi:hypothetical protein
MKPSLMPRTGMIAYYSLLRKFRPDDSLDLTASRSKAGQAIHGGSRVSLCAAFTRRTIATIVIWAVGLAASVLGVRPRSLEWHHTTKTT